jgi:hypothetical protein
MPSAGQKDEKIKRIKEELKENANRLKTRLSVITLHLDGLQHRDVVVALLLAERISLVSACSRLRSPLLTTLLTGSLFDRSFLSFPAYEWTGWQR